MSSVCFQRQVSSSFSGKAEINRLIALIGLPPGLEQPASRPKIAYLEHATLNEDDQDTVDVAEAPKNEEANAFAVAQHVQQIHLMQQARWNYEYARAAQKTAYIMHMQALHRHDPQQMPDCVGAAAWAQLSSPMSVGMPQDDVSKCKLPPNTTGVGSKPPGVWHQPARKLSCASNTSTTASSDDKSNSEDQGSPTRIVTDADIDHMAPSSHQLRIEIPKEKSFCTGGLRIFWPVDARKLRSYDPQIVSPAFELLPGVEFKLLVMAVSKGEKRGQAGFKAARGRGILKLKCVAGVSSDLPPLTCQFSLQSSDGKPRTRGLVTHDFQQESMCGLPQQNHEWDLDAAVDYTSRSFVVCLEVAPMSSGVPN